MMTSLFLEGGVFGAALLGAAVALPLGMPVAIAIGGFGIAAVLLSVRRRHEPDTPVTRYERALRFWRWANRLADVSLLLLVVLSLTVALSIARAP